MLRELSSSNDDGGPSEQNYATTGLIGVTVFATVLVINCLGYKYRGNYSPFFLVFFSALSLVCIFELPRYVEMIRMRDYSSQGGYAVHIVASYFYFFSLTVIARLWSSVAELGRIEKNIYSKGTLVTLNFALLLVVVASIYYCLRADSLFAFFDSDMFALLTVAELVVGLLYSTCLSFLSVKLVMRFHRYANDASSTKVSKSGRPRSSDINLSEGFKEVMYKVFFSFSVLVFCNLIRLGMLLVKLRNNFMDDFFIEYGNYWFLWTDFIPRGLGCLALIYLMFYKPIKMSRFSRERRSTATSDALDSVEKGGEVANRDSVVSVDGGRYRRDTEVEEEILSYTDNPLRPHSGRFSENPLRPNSGRFSVKGPGMELKNNPTTLMTDFFRESEDFDKELRKAMESK